RPKIKLGALKSSANSKEYILVDADSGVILAQNGKSEKVPIASTTKIMTAIIALENYQLTDIATISTDAVSQVPSVAYLRTGEHMTVENLLNCMLIPSGNDAAYAVAEHMSDDTGGTAKFVAKMNEKAKELGMADTHYEDPAGLNAEGYSTAYDLSIITKYALRNQTFRQIISKSSYVAKNTDGTIFHSLKQSNRLVTENYAGAIGVKTGFTPEAGHCLVGAATRNGHTLISIVLNTYSTTPDASAIEAKRLLDWGFQNTEWE
ncbi:MAG TPA: D-alanyl-D-alanine carboxypeptidase family protein, partial [Candidatus Cloacimonadota bacterium]|nr:D-alanyl-D-alanine carboxypeptidase family protein [Candidatus Cloacimonadota bacterium]